MAAKSFQLGTDDELQAASSLASLHLRDGVGIGNTGHMEDNPEPNAALPAITSPPPDQSQQQAEIAPPADQGKIKSTVSRVWMHD